MSANEFAGNLLAYSLQVAVLAGAGLLAAGILRLRAPRALHIFYQAVLAGCILLPLVQPWRVRVATGVAESTVQAAGAAEFGATAFANWGFAEWTLAIFAGGIAGRLAWLSLGLYRLRILRRQAAELQLLPREIETACQAIGTKARFFVSPESGGPATFGLFHPVVLLPIRFLEFRPELREAIVRHELIHVQRRDWAATLYEEAVRTLFWFHPVVWLLVGRIRLTREQVVDRLAAGAAASRRTYAEALIAIASSIGLTPRHAPAFAAECRLASRVSLLLKEVPVSRSRLVLSLIAAAGTAAAAGVGASRFFPFDLTASPAIADVEAPKPARVSGRAKQVTPAKKTQAADNRVYKIGDGVVAPKLISKIEPKYSEQARDAKLQGTVKLGLIVDQKGHPQDIEVLAALEPSLDKNAVEAVRKWVFQPGTKQGKPVRVRATIEVNFKLL